MFQHTSKILAHRSLTCCRQLEQRRAPARQSEPTRQLQHSKRRQTEAQAGLRLPSVRRRWKVRPLKPEELMEAAQIQFDGFYETLPAAGILNALFKMRFRGVVVSGLQNKLRYEAEDRCASSPPNSQGLPVYQLSPAASFAKHPMTLCTDKKTLFFWVLIFQAQDHR